MWPHPNRASRPGLAFLAAHLALRSPSRCPRTPRTSRTPRLAHTAHASRTPRTPRAHRARIARASKVREELLLDVHALSERTLKKVWLALDKDSSGFITAGEFGAFMRRGERILSAPVHWRERAHQARTSTRLLASSVRPARTARPPDPARPGPARTARPALPARSAVHPASPTCQPILWRSREPPGAHRPHEPAHAPLGRPRRGLLMACGPSAMRCSTAT